MAKQKRKTSSARIVDRREDINLSKSIFGEACCNELREIDKHEIIVKICDILGPKPENLCMAEEIFDNLKLDITRYVIHHEYSKESSIRSRLLLWLDTKSNPHTVEALSDFMKKYLK